MMKPEPDSSTGLVLPGWGGLVASTETTAGEALAATASNRTDKCRWATSAKAAGGGVWAVTAVECGAIATAARPPPNEQSPKNASKPSRFSMAIPPRDVEESEPAPL